MQNLLYIAIAIFLFGFVFELIGVYLRYIRINGFAKTEAVITEVTEVPGMAEDQNYKVIVSYTVNGKAYSGKMDFYRSDYQPGKKIVISYHPNDPQKIYGPAETLGLIFLISGFLVVLSSFAVGLIAFLFG